MNEKGLLVVFSGPSGAGKDTVLKRLLELNDNLCLSVSATTRAPREGEADGKDYFFLTRGQFEGMIEKGELLEYASYCGNLYGTPRAPVEEALAQGRDVILEIEVKGAGQVMQNMPGCVSVFLTPPSLEVLEQRLRSRQTESEEAIQKRLAIAREEMGHAAEYGYRVVNDSVERAAQEMLGLLREEKAHRRRGPAMAAYSRRAL